ncbi:hypothetical protein C9374_013567 [Naegleria lovaniensis]|uniref:Uncharacterized protein n=1 Tax=Naegleria lovaniensis TaxID=51637 RepID=A0AA88H2J8_NAELO|nr:uncharacterized protein C9374_013567 [Naegleria lovaniensis]KAG2392082.1 hypothetical protein C9374_013567 [Naegleria lovaniensis]
MIHHDAHEEAFVKGSSSFINNSFLFSSSSYWFWKLIEKLLINDNNFMSSFQHSHLPPSFNHITAQVLTSPPSPDYTLFWYGRNDTKPETQEQQEKITYIALYGFLVPFLLIMVITLLILMIRSWKEMVLNKRLMYILILLLNFNQLFSMLFGIAHAVCTLLKLEEVISVIFYMFHYEGVIASLGLSIFCKTMTTRVVYMIYFNKEQSWVREGQMKWRRRFVKIIGIAVTVLGMVTLLVMMPTICVTATVYYYPGVNQDMAREAAINRYFTDALAGILYIVIMTFMGILNCVLVAALVRKLMMQNSQLGSTAASSQRKAVCQRILILTCGQLFLGLSMELAACIAIFGIFTRYLFIVSSFLQTFNIILFSLVIIFSFGPLDFIVSEGLMKVSHRRLEKLNSKANITKTCSAKDLVTTVRNDVKGDDELKRTPSDIHCQISTHSLESGRASSPNNREYKRSLSSSRNSNRDSYVAVSPFSPSADSESGGIVPELCFPSTAPSEFLESSVV